MTCLAMMKNKIHWTFQRAGGGCEPVCEMNPSSFGAVGEESEGSTFISS